jgi:hypothetical protein
LEAYQVVLVERPLVVLPFLALEVRVVHRREVPMRRQQVLFQA